jgi:hypothetical protein
MGQWAGEAEMDLDQATDIRQSQAPDELENRHVGDQVTAGQFVLEILDAHRHYIDAALFDRNDEGSWLVALRTSPRYAGPDMPPFPRGGREIGTRAC